MLENIRIEKNIDFLTKIMTFLTKIGILMGGLCIGFYSLKNGHFPQGITIGDSFLFLVTAGCFGFVYVLFVASLIAMGVLSSPIVRPCLSGIFRLARKILKKGNSSPKYKLKKFDWKFIFLLPVFLPILLAFGRQDSSVYEIFPVLIVALYIIYSVYEGVVKEIKKMGNFQVELVEHKEKYSDIEKINFLKRNKTMLGAVILFLPLVLSGAVGQLLDSAMRAANIRIEKTSAYIAEPYFSILNANAVKIFGDYKKVEGLTVVFRGFGKNTLVSYGIGKDNVRLEIPNNKIML